MDFGVEQDQSTAYTGPRRAWPRQDGQTRPACGHCASLHRAARHRCPARSADADWRRAGPTPARHTGRAWGAARGAARRQRRPHAPAMRFHHDHRRSGIALIMVMVIVVVFAVLAGGLAMSMKVET